MQVDNLDFVNEKFDMSMVKKLRDDSFLSPQNKVSLPCCVHGSKY